MTLAAADEAIEKFPAFYLIITARNFSGYGKLSASF